LGSYSNKPKCSGFRVPRLQPERDAGGIIGLIIRPNKLKYPIYVPITYSSNNNSIFLPARSQELNMHS